MVRGKGPRRAQAPPGHALLPCPNSTPGATGINRRICHCATLASHPGPEVGERLWLEVELVKGCGRGAFLQPLDMAGLTEQVVLQGVAAVAVFVIELQATVLGEAKGSSGSQTK